MKGSELTTGLIIQHLSLESQTLYVAQLAAPVHIVARRIETLDIDDHEFQVAACNCLLDRVIVDQPRVGLVGTAVHPFIGTLAACHEVPLGAGAGVLFGGIDLIVQRIPLVVVAVADTEFGKYLSLSHVCDEYHRERIGGIPERNPLIGKRAVEQPFGRVDGHAPCRGS